MNLNVLSRNSYFPVRSLPVVVIYHVAEYLSRCDLQNMAQVDRYLRKLFNSPRLWKDIRIRIPDKKIDPQVLEIIRVRGITDMEIVNVNFDLQLTTLQPHLERLKLRVTTVNTLQVLCKAASSGHLNKLKNLAFGKIDYRIGHQSKVTFLELFKNLPMIEEVRFVSSFTECEQRICVPLTYEVLIYLLRVTNPFGSNCRIPCISSYTVRDANLKQSRSGRPLILREDTSSQPPKRHKK